MSGEECYLRLLAFSFIYLIYGKNQDNNKYNLLVECWARNCENLGSSTSHSKTPMWV